MKRILMIIGVLFLNFNLLRGETHKYSIGLSYNYNVAALKSGLAVRRTPFDFSDIVKLDSLTTKRTPLFFSLGRGHSLTTDFTAYTNGSLSFFFLYKLLISTPWSVTLNNASTLQIKGWSNQFILGLNHSVPFYENIIMRVGFGSIVQAAVVRVSYNQLDGKIIENFVINGKLAIGLYSNIFLEYPVHPKINLFTRCDYSLLNYFPAKYRLSEIYIDNKLMPKDKVGNYEPVYFKDEANDMNLSERVKTKIPYSSIGFSFGANILISQREAGRIYRN